MLVTVGSAVHMSSADSGAKAAAPGKAAPKKAAAAGSGSAKDAEPKITSITPAAALIDGGGTVDVLVRGSNLKVTSPKIRFESEPSRGVFFCTVDAASVRSTELKCKVTITDLVAGEPVKFAVEWTKGKDVVVGAMSTATFTGNDPLLAKRACAVKLGSGDLQLHLRGRGIADAATVKVIGPAPATAELPCTNLHPLGSDDLVCYVSGAKIGSKHAIQLLRKQERATSSSTNTADLTITKC